MARQGGKARRLGLVGAALLLFTALAHGERSSPASSDILSGNGAPIERTAADSPATEETGTGTAGNCADQGPQDKPLGTLDELAARFNACVRCGSPSISEGGTVLSVETLVKYPPCVLRVLAGLTPVLVVFVAILMEQSISGFRRGLRLALALSCLSLFGAIFGLSQVGQSQSIVYLALVFLAALFGGAMAHWLVYIRDLLPVVGLGFGLFALLHFAKLSDHEEPVAWVAGTLGGVWLFWWRNRSKSSNARRELDRTKATTGNGSTA